MNIDRETGDIATRRERGRRLAWLAVGVSVVATLILLGSAQNRARATNAPGSATRLLEQSAPAVPQHVASLSDEVDWSTKESAGDPSPLSVAAYER
jgi:hypothetical protein